MERNKPVKNPIDDTLDDSFPASDPPGWTMGRDRDPNREPVGNGAAPQPQGEPQQITPPQPAKRRGRGKSRQFGGRSDRN